MIVRRVSGIAMCVNKLTISMMNRKLIRRELEVCLSINSLLHIMVMYIILGRNSRENINTNLMERKDEIWE